MSRTKYFVEAKNFINPIKPEIIYILGFLWADGCVFNNTIELSMNYHDTKDVVVSSFNYLKPSL